MYKNDFVAVVKENGKILRENGNTVYLPFGCEYSILLKNLRSRKAVVKVSIDGQDVLNGSRLIVNPNSELELERFLEDMDKGNRFKFIQKTSKIQEHRGDKVDDGIIRIEFQYEAEVLQRPLVDWTYMNNEPLTTFPNHKYYGTPISCNYDNSSANYGINPTMYASMNVSNATPRRIQISADSTTDGLISGEGKVKLDSIQPLQDEGITVKGSESTQQFKVGSVGILENESHVITLMLKGHKADGSEIIEPLTVKTKKICPTCGEQNKSTNKYCADCGTFLN
jgi:hypothetical protein